MSWGCGFDSGRINVALAVPHSTFTKRTAKVEHFMDTDAGCRL